MRKFLIQAVIQEEGRLMDEAENYMSNNRPKYVELMRKAKSVKFKLKGGVDFSKYDSLSILFYHNFNYGNDSKIK